ALTARAAPRGPSEPLDAPVEAGGTDAVDDPSEPPELAPAAVAGGDGTVDGGESDGALVEPEYDAYDEVEGLVPPPPRLRRSGFPRSMYPQRRRLVRAAV